MIVQTGALPPLGPGKNPGKPGQTTGLPPSRDHASPETINVSPNTDLFLFLFLLAQVSPPITLPDHFGGTGLPRSTPRIGPQLSGTGRCIPVAQQRIVPSLRFRRPFGELGRRLDNHAASLLPTADHRGIEFHDQVRCHVVDTVATMVQLALPRKRAPIDLSIEFRFPWWSSSRLPQSAPGNRRFEPVDASGTLAGKLFCLHRLAGSDTLTFSCLARHSRVSGCWSRVPLGHRVPGTVAAWRRQLNRPCAPSQTSGFQISLSGIQAMSE
ncbi:hypothetical protein E9229_001220 [Paeniglutamicibacter cryotolerans]|uniref:Uncharacterized protein n=1 Tax=Paeniglutamicibacter cryotolerans TaxID=670079 RepID=A0A839QFV0_9MICC|nr:hypothetical protein [Paeniglutamicibacter cryotolerans]